MAHWAHSLPYFPRHELADRMTGQLRLDLRFAAELPKLRKEWGSPLYPTSACRSLSTNRAVGGHPRSLHLIDNPVHKTTGTMAIDIAWEDWNDDILEQHKFYKLAWSMGWSCGLSNKFIHLDRRVDLGLMQATFHYDGWTEKFADMPSL